MKDTEKISLLLQVSETDKSQSTSVNVERGEKRTDTEDNSETKMDSPTASSAPESNDEGAPNLTPREKRRKKHEQKKQRQAGNQPQKLDMSSREKKPGDRNGEPAYGVGHWPRVLVITSEDGQQVPLGHYAVAKAVEGLTTNPKRLTKAKAGYYVVEVTTDSASKILLSSTKLANTAVKITPHRSLNTTRGVISSRFLEGASDADLLDDLRNQGVTKVKRILRNKKDPTNAIILTFGSPVMKDQVLVLNQALEVKAYLPPPMRCFKCQKFGHTKTKCAKKHIVCPKCADAHPENECQTDTLKCANCNGQHSTFDKQCPKYIEIKRLLEISAKKRISIKEARKELQTAKDAAFAKKAAPKKPTANINATQQNSQLTVAEPDLVLKEKLEAHAIAIRDLLKEQKDMKKAIDDNIREIQSRDEIINQQEAQIQRLTVDLDRERRRKPASTQELELANAKLIQQESLNKKQQESIAELNRKVAQLQSKIQAEDKNEKDESKSHTPISLDKGDHTDLLSSSSLGATSKGPAKATGRAPASKGPAKATGIAPKPSSSSLKKPTSSLKAAKSINNPGKLSKKSKQTEEDLSNVKVLSPKAKPEAPVAPPRTPKTSCTTLSKSTSINSDKVKGRDSNKDKSLKNADEGPESKFSPPVLRRKQLANPNGGTIENK